MQWIKLMTVALLAVQLQVENGQLKDNVIYNQSEKALRVHFFIPEKTETIQWQIGDLTGKIDNIKKEDDQYHAYVDLPSDSQWKGKLKYTINQEQYESEQELCYDTIEPDVTIRWKQEGKKEDILYFYPEAIGTIEGEECEIQWYRNGKPIEMESSFEIQESGLYEIVCTDASQNKKTFVFDVETQAPKMWMEGNILCIEDRNFDEKKVKCDLISNPKWQHTKQGHKLDISQGVKDGIYHPQVQYESKAGVQVDLQPEIKIDHTPPKIVNIQYEKPIQEKENILFFNHPISIDLQVQDELSDIETIEWKYGSETGIVQGNNHISIPLQQENADVLHIKVKDQAGNVLDYVSKERFILDSTPPEIEITGLDKEYVNQPIQGKIIVQEANFDSEDFQSDVQIEWKENVGTFVVEKEGEYTLPFTYVDGSGNAAKEQSFHVVLDYTAPELHIQYPEGHERQGILYISKPSKIQIEAKDVNPAEIYMNDQKIENRIEIQQEGVHKLEVYAKDAAGNESKRQTLKPIILDSKIDVLDVQMHGKAVKEDIYTSHVKMDVICKDAHYESGTMHLAREDAYGQVKEWNQKIEEGKTSFQFQEDGRYTGWIEINDQAQNVKKEHIQFTINQKGSKFSQSEYVKRLMNATVQKVEQPIHVQEYNVNATQSKVSIVKDGKIQVQPNYTKIGNAYHIFTSNFKEDGIYKVRIHSIDEAGHENQKEDIYFKVDTTPPSIHMHALHGNLNQAEYRIFDAMGLKTIEVLRDGKKIDAKEISQDVHEWKQTINHQNQKIEVIAKDVAGNENKVQFYKENVQAQEVKMRDFTPYWILIGFALACVVKYKKD